MAPRRPSIFSSESTQRANFSSQVKLEPAGQAMPAAASFSYQRRVTFQTAVDANVPAVGPEPPSNESALATALSSTARTGLP